MTSLTWDEVFGLRLARHHLLEPAPSPRLLDVVGAVCGIHAQVTSSAELSIGARVAGLTALDVRRELWERRSLVKTYGLRGTVHLFPAAELPLWMAALREARPEAMRHSDPWDLDGEQRAAVVQAIADALDGRRLTRQQLGDEVVRRLGGWAGEEVFPAWGGTWPRWMPALAEAAYAGVACFGPPEGSRVTFVRPDDWLGGWTEAGGEEALAEVLRRYLAAFGPVTDLEVGQWLATSPGRARRALDRLAGELLEVDVEGRPALLLAADAGARWTPARGSVRLLPQFDVYVVGSHPRDALIPPVHVGRAFEGRELPRWMRSGRPLLAGPTPVLLIDGLVAGRWTRRRVGRRLEVLVEPFRELTAPERRQLAAEGDRVAEILGAEVALSVG